MVDSIATLDAWLLQAIGGTAKYGNGAGGLVHVGRVPSGSAAPDWKSRGVFKIVLRNAGGTGVLDDITSVSAATFELTVGGESCLVGGRGNNFYAFLEEMTSVFTEKPAASDCVFGSGTGTGVWGADSGVTTTNRAFKSSPGLTSGNKVSFNILAMIQAALADASQMDLWCRVIFANSAGTAYDETAAAARATGFYTRENATSTNRPVLQVTGGTTAVAKSSTDTLTITETHSVNTGDTTPSDDDAITLAEAVIYAGPIPVWQIANGRGKVQLERGPVSLAETIADVGATYATLPAVVQQNSLSVVRFSLNKVPATAGIRFGVMTRVVSLTVWYAVVAFARPTGIGIAVLRRTTTGAPSFLVQALDLRPLQANQDYWLKLLVQGINPTVIAARLWRDGEGEPAGYQLTTQDGTAALQVSAGVGLMASMAGNVTNKPVIVSFDDFSSVSA